MLRHMWAPGCSQSICGRKFDTVIDSQSSFSKFLQLCFIQARVVLLQDHRGFAGVEVQGAIPVLWLDASDHNHLAFKFGNLLHKTILFAGIIPHPNADHLHRVIQMDCHSLLPGVVHLDEPKNIEVQVPAGDAWDRHVSKEHSGFNIGGRSVAGDGFKLQLFKATAVLIGAEMYAGLAFWAKGTLETNQVLPSRNFFDVAMLPHNMTSETFRARDIESTGPPSSHRPSRNHTSQRMAARLWLEKCRSWRWQHSNRQGPWQQCPEAEHCVSPIYSPDHLELGLFTASRFATKSKSCDQNKTFDIFNQNHNGIMSKAMCTSKCFVLFGSLGPKVKCCIGQLWVLKQITIHDHTLNVKRVHGVCCQACNMLISKQLATCGTLSKITFFLLKHIWQLIAIAKCKIHTISPWTTEPVIRGTLSKIIPWWRLEGTSRLSRTQSQLQQHAQFPEQFAPQSVSSCLVLWSKDEMQNWPGVGFKANRTPWSRLECKARPRCLASDLQHVDFQTSSCVVH